MVMVKNTMNKNNIHFNKTFFQKGKEELRKIAMTAEEKRAMHDRLLNCISFPVPTPYEPQSGWLVVSKWLMPRHLAYAALPFVFLFVISGSLAFAAEGSVPGELLYPIKVEITEPVRNMLTLSGTAKAYWEARKAERRLEEAESLAVRGDLDTQKREELESRFDNHTKNLAVISNKLEKGVGDKVRDNLEVSLEAHAEVLDTIGKHSDRAQGEEIGKFTKKVKELVQVVEEKAAAVKAKAKAASEWIGDTATTSDDKTVDSDADADTKPEPRSEPKTDLEESSVFEPQGVINASIKTAAVKNARVFSEQEVKVKKEKSKARGLSEEVL